MNGGRCLWRVLPAGYGACRGLGRQPQTVVPDTAPVLHCDGEAEVGAAQPELRMKGVDDMVITTAKGRNYHRPDCGPGFLSTRAKNELLGRKLHPILEMTRDEALALGKKACGHCGGQA